jgi:hypothetical protein
MEAIAIDDCSNPTVCFTSCVSAMMDTRVLVRSFDQTTARFQNGVLRNLHSRSPRKDKRSKAGVEVVEAWSLLGAEQE